MVYDMSLSKYCTYDSSEISKGFLKPTEYVFGSFLVTQHNNYANSKFSSLNDQHSLQNPLYNNCSQVPLFY